MYFLIMRAFFIDIATLFALLHVVTFGIIYSTFTNNDKYLNFFTDFYPVAILAIAYFLTKAFGIFGIIEKYNKFKQFLIILLLCILFKLSYRFVPYRLEGYDYLTDISCYLLPAWILRKFFNFLTLKFPYPFKEIGYIFSFEYYRNLFLNKKINDEK